MNRQRHTWLKESRKIKRCLERATWKQVLKAHPQVRPGYNPLDEDATLFFMNYIVFSMIGLAVIYGIWKEVHAKKSGEPVIADKSAAPGKSAYATIKEEDLEMIAA